jgi:CheY-like chemotaxis protein
MPQLGGLGALGRMKALQPGDPHERHALAGAPAPASLAAEQKPLVRARVLVTDDEVEMRRMLAEHCRNVIVVTALEQLESAQEALQLGANDYVTKPFSLRELDTVLESHTQMSRSTSVAR